MLRTDLLVALRQLKHHLGYAALNIAGLAVGLACCLLILLFVRDELSFDTTHPEVDRLFRVERDVTVGSSAGAELQRRASIQSPIAEEAIPQVAGVESVMRLARVDEPLVVRGDVRLKEDRFLYADPSLFSMLDTEVVRGSVADLSRPNTLILDEPTASTYFGDADPVGETMDIRIQAGDSLQVFEVVGVMREMPRTAHVYGDIVASYASRPVDPDMQWFKTASTYVRLEDGVDPTRVAASLEAVLDRIRAASDERTVIEAETHLVPVKDIHLRSVAEGEIEPQGDIRYVWLFSAIALAILLIAGINYMNLATVHGARRAREVGVRKAIGAGKGQLVRQFLSESFVVTLAALVLALGLVQLTLPWFGEWMSRSLSIPFAELWLWGVLVGTVLILSVGAGSYPAFVLSAVQAQSALKGKARTISNTTLRKILVAGQFTATVALIVCTIGIHRQLAYVQDTRLGFDPEQTLILEASGAFDADGAVFKQAAEGIPGVQQIAYGSGVPGKPSGIRFYRSTDIEGQESTEERAVVFDWLSVGADYASVLDLGLVEGRGFSADRPSDIGTTVLVNETAVQSLGWEDPVGKTMGSGENQVTVVGVVQDFHLADMRTEIGPMLIDYDPEATGYAVLKLSAANLSETLAAIEAAWDASAPEHLFDALFLDDHFAAMYRAEMLVGQVFFAFSLLAILVACLGLFGLAMLAAEQRTKEIGVRKVLGASVASRRSSTPCRSLPWNQSSPSWHDG
ncbi:MAG: ABC transporter permease [Bacteroidota bacterium]